MDEDGVKAIAADVLKTDASVAFSKELTRQFKPGHHYHQRVPPTVLTYSYTAGEGAEATVEADKAQTVAKDTIGQDATAEIVDGKLVITPADGSRIANSVEESLTDALTSNSADEHSPRFFQRR